MKELANTEVNMEEFAKNVLAPTLPEYKVLHNKNHIFLQNEVVSHLNDGWSLVGGIALATYVTQYEVSLIFSQAVAKNI